MDTRNPLCVSELLSSLHRSINGYPYRPRSARSASLTFGFILPIAWYCQLIGVEMINESGIIELPSLLTWQLVGDAGNCYQKCNCSGLCLQFQQSSPVFLLRDIRYLPFLSYLRQRTTCEVNPTGCWCRGALRLGAVLVHRSQRSGSPRPRGVASSLPKARVPPSHASGSLGTEQPLWKLIAWVLVVSHKSGNGN